MPWSAHATDTMWLRGVRCGFLFQIDRTLIWWVVFMNCMPVYTKCFCWEDTYCTYIQALEKWFWCFITALIHLFGDFFFIYPWVIWVDPLPTFIAAYPVNFILFSAFWYSLLAIYSTSRFSFWLIFVQYICGVLFNIIRVNLLSSADKCREINNWYAH